MILRVVHLPDKKRPCLVLECGNQSVILGYLTNRTREKWLKKAYGLSDSKSWAIPVYPCEYNSIEELLESVEE